MSVSVEVPLTGDLAMTLGSDGLPVFASNATVSQSLFTRCTDTNCSVGGVSAPLGIAGVQLYHAIAIGADGFPVIAYQLLGTGLVVTKCATISCSSQPANPTVDATGTTFVSIALGADTFPVMSYTSSAGQLKVAKCVNTACTGTSTLTVVDTVGSSGVSSSIRVPADGLPVISYSDDTNNRLRVAKCGNASCSAGNTLTTVDTRSGTGQLSALTISTDGLPIISYYDASTGDLRVVKCGNAACNSGNAVVIAESVGDVGNYSSIVLGKDGSPIITHYDAGAQSIRVFKCTTPSCALP